MCPTPSSGSWGSLDKPGSPQTLCAGLGATMVCLGQSSWTPERRLRDHCLCGLRATLGAGVTGGPSGPACLAPGPRSGVRLSKHREGSLIKQPVF